MVFVHQRRRQLAWLSVEADPIYRTILIAAEKAFWRVVKTGETQVPFDCKPYEAEDPSSLHDRHERPQHLGRVYKATPPEWRA
jgi:hypothetical protein